MQCERTTRSAESVVVEPTIARTILSNVSLPYAFGKTSRPSSTTRMSLARSSRSPSMYSSRAALSPRDHSEDGVQDTKRVSWRSRRLSLSQARQTTTHPAEARPKKEHARARAHTHTATDHLAPKPENGEVMWRVCPYWLKLCWTDASSTPSESYTTKKMRPCESCAAWVCARLCTM